jgi:hypothetical protein
MKKTIRNERGDAEGDVGDAGRQQQEARPQRPGGWLSEGLGDRLAALRANAADGLLAQVVAALPALHGLADAQG